MIHSDQAITVRLKLPIKEMQSVVASDAKLLPNHLDRVHSSVNAIKSAVTFNAIAWKQR